MRLETFRGRDVSSVHALARRSLGDDALILETRAVWEGSRAGIEVIAVPATDLATLTSLVLRPGPTQRIAAAGPRIVALIGPTGAGKTTTIAKLATHPRAFGTQRVGLLTLDSHRAAGFEQLQAYAEAAGLPCAIAYDTMDAIRAMQLFADCDVVLVDTAGRSPASDTIRRARALLAALRPDEIHLVVPSTLRPDLVAGVRDAHRLMRPTHTLLTKLDESPSDRTLGLIASGLGLPMRWVTDGQDVPAHLRPAARAILAPLGLAHHVVEAA